MESRIGIREAKGRFSELVKAAAKGRSWIITDRGRPVARLMPASSLDESIESRLSDLESQGLLVRARPTAPLPPLIKTATKGVGQKFLRESRDASG